MNYISNESVPQTQTVSYDEGLRQFMLGVYNYMTLALAISGLVSLGISMSPELMASIWGTPFKWVAIFLPVVLSFGIPFVFDKITVRQAQIAMGVFAAAMGLSLSSIFMITAATFGTASLYGYTTKKDLTSFGSFLIMGVIGIVIAGLVNLFLQSSILAFVISCISVLIFTGLTAYDTQQLKTTYDFTTEDEREKAGIYGALQLYLDFINIFVNLLQLIGDRKND
jgi:FtsH-binding integral membrane protein